MGLGPLAVAVKGTGYPTLNPVTGYGSKMVPLAGLVRVAVGPHAGDTSTVMAVLALGLFPGPSDWTCISTL